MGGSDAASKAGRVFVELEHARAKERLARSALNRRFDPSARACFESATTNSLRGPPHF
jgi:hypothetical protein